MTDRNETTIAIGTRVRFRPTCRDHGLWLTGTVRAVRPWTYQRPAATVWEALVDDGDPENADMHSNGFHVAAWLESKDIAVLEEVAP